MVKDKLSLSHHSQSRKRRRQLRLLPFSPKLILPFELSVPLLLTFLPHLLYLLDYSGHLRLTLQLGLPLDPTAANDKLSTRSLREPRRKRLAVPSMVHLSNML